MINAQHIFRENILRMPPYVPGEQPPAGTKIIKLNTNENPYPPSPAVGEAIRMFNTDDLRRYSDPFSKAFCKAAATVLGVPENCILAGNGSDDLLAMIVLACLAPERKVAYPAPTYVLYRTLAQMQDCRIVEVPFDDEYNLPVSGLIEADAAVVFIARPNSPSGTACGLDLIEQVAAGTDGLVVVDEAYVDFAEDSAIELIRKHENIILLRTLSKGYSLAGLRLGFAVGNPDVLATLNKVKDSYPVDALANVIGAAAIADQDYKNENARKVRLGRATVSRDLREMNFTLMDSQSNFVLARPADGKAHRLYQGLKDKGILVRYFKEARLDDKLRISIGTDEENAELLKALAGLVG